MPETKELNRELSDIFQLFCDDRPVSFETINTSRSDIDFREVVIAEFSSGKKVVIKLADNHFTFPEKIKVWQRTIEEYRRLGYYCPEIISDKTGNFPKVAYKGHSCVAYAEEYSVYRPAEYRSAEDSECDKISAEKYEDDAWIMTAKIAAEYLSYTDYPSGYCLFETFCPSDKIDEVLEEALEWKKYAQTLPEEFQTQIDRIWRLWTDNRNALERVYKKIPTSVFQADLNSTNILVDETGKFVGVYDFNLCGKDVFLNYLIRETYNYTGFQEELDAILLRLKLVSGYYHFSDIEKQTVLMLYRCIKPLWCNKTDKLKGLSDDKSAIKNFLDETEEYLTKDIDFSSYMQESV